MSLSIRVATFAAAFLGIVSHVSAADALAISVFLFDGHSNMEGADAVVAEPIAKRDS